MSFSAVITFLTSSATPITAPADIGIAAAYPGDKNIASDPAVIFADDFESYTAPADAVAKWGRGGPLKYMRIATEPEHVYSGSKAIEFALPNSTTEVAVSLYKFFAQTQDTLYARWYQKFDANYSMQGSNHNGIRLSAKYPDTPTK